MDKYAFTLSSYGANDQRTVGSLKHRILSDPFLSAYDKQKTLQELNRELRNQPDSTPLYAILSRVGGGALGLLVAKYFNMGLPGQVVATAAGFGVGKTLSDFYRSMTDPRSNVVRFN
jgi:hypothetical protein